MGALPVRRVPVARAWPGSERRPRPRAAHGHGRKRIEYDSSGSLRLSAFESVPSQVHYGRMDTFKFHSIRVRTKQIMRASAP